MFVIAFALLASMQTDFGVRTPPGAPATQVPNVTVVRPKHKPPPSKKKGMFACTVQSVTDGDAFRCANGTRVRLSSIDTPEMPGSCRPGRACAPGDPYTAKAALQRLISGRTVQCEQVGMSYNRVAAWCSVNGADLSCAMVRRGHAIRLPNLDRRRRLCR
jgi:endonuclease YncB( thermonuclease family)